MREGRARIRHAQLLATFLGGSPDDYLVTEKTSPPENNGAGQKALGAFLKAAAPKGFKPGETS